MPTWLNSHAPQPLQFAPLAVVAHAMCCAVGHTAPAASAAIAAQMNHFRETQFVCHTGQAIRAGTLFGVDTWGRERLVQMQNQVVAECLASWPGLDRAKVAVVLLSAEATRHGVPAGLGAELVQLLLQTFGFHTASQACDLGKAGIATALHIASGLLRQPGPAPSHILLLGVDSLLQAPAIEQYLSAERLVTEDNADGFFPGEGAAALLLTRPAPDRMARLWIEAIGQSVDPWRLAGEHPARAQGLTDAVKTTLAQAQVGLADLAFHASGATGEGWYSKEVAMMLSRCMEHKRPHFPHVMLAKHLGETGAAGPVLTLAWLAHAMDGQRGVPGTSGLAHFAGDDGLRAALVLRHRLTTVGALSAAR